MATPLTLQTRDEYAVSVARLEIGSRRQPCLATWSKAGIITQGPAAQNALHPGIRQIPTRLKWGHVWVLTNSTEKEAPQTCLNSPFGPRAFHGNAELSSDACAAPSGPEQASHRDWAVPFGCTEGRGPRALHCWCSHHSRLLFP